MPNFHETVMGSRFFQAQLPKTMDTLNGICNALHEANEIAVRTNLIAIEANELKKRELDLLERMLNEEKGSKI